MRHSEPGAGPATGTGGPGETLPGRPVAGYRYAGIKRNRAGTLWRNLS